MDETQKTVEGSGKPSEGTGQKGAIAVRGPELTKADVQRVKDSMDAFNELKNVILKAPADKVRIKNKEAITRAGFSKIAMAFNVSTEITKTNRIVTKDNYIVHVTARAITSWGRFAEGTASCTKEEFKTGMLEFSIHNCEAKAATRATNRAIANLVGGGILDAESASIKLDMEDQPAMPEPVSKAQLDYINRLENNGGAQVTDYIAKVLNSKGKVLSALTKDEAREVIDAIKSGAYAKNNKS